MDPIKTFYEGYPDRIWDERFNSPYPIRRYAHRAQYDAILAHVHPGDTVLDAGCGEGVIPILLAKRGLASVGIDMSFPNVESARRTAGNAGLGRLTSFKQGDAEQLPFPDKAFDVVISSHVLEHLPDFDAGWKELCRVAKRRIIVALPTPLNACAFPLLGGDYGYWRLTWRSPVAFAWGAVRVLSRVFSDGVQEGYVGHKELPHVWRYPWTMRRMLKHPQWQLVRFEASTLCMPYFGFLLPLVRFLDRHRDAPVLRNLGLGSIAVYEPRTSAV